MNYGISILFRAIPLVMALFCFGYGAFIYGYGDAGGRVVAGPVVFSLGMICIALFATAGTIIRQIIHTYSTAAKYALPIIGYLAYKNGYNNKGIFYKLIYKSRDKDKRLR